MSRAGVYIHIPFCTLKSIGSQFYSVEKRERLIPKFIQSIAREIENSNIETLNWTIDTLFIGGGAPNLVKPKLIEKILCLIDKKYDLSKLDEVTIEINPGETPLEYLYDYIKMGINRISIVAQTFDPALLKSLKSSHTGNDTINAYKNIRRAGFENVNLDLLYLIPGQTIQNWEMDLKKVIDLEPEHISTYALDFEMGTELSSLVSKGMLPSQPLDLDVKFFQMAHDNLSLGGYYPYEVSSFCKQGYSCKHNLHYWNIEPYLAFGPSAHGFDGKNRWYNIDSLDHYINTVDSDRSPICNKEHLTEINITNELVGFRMRMTKGLDLKKIPKALREEYRRKIMNVVSKYPDYFKISESTISFNENGLILSDQIIPEMLLLK